MKKEYFSFEGRLSRKKYFKRIFLLTFIYMIVAVIFTLMMIGGGLSVIPQCCRYWALSC